MLDIHGGKFGEGDLVYVLTSPHSGSKYKRLFAATCVKDLSDSKGEFECAENRRVVSVTSASVVVPRSRRY